MAYEKQTWTTGEVITAEKLNHMEDGIADAGGGGSAMFYVGTSDPDLTTLDKTFAEIKAAYNSGQLIALRHEQWGDNLTGYNMDYLSEITLVNEHDTGYFVRFPGNGSALIYHASAESDYPTLYNDDL